MGLGLIIFQFAKFKNLKIVKFLKLKIQISQALYSFKVRHPKLGLERKAGGPPALRFRLK